MRSRVHIQSHPLHPILVPFPIAFFTGSFLFDLAGWLFNEPLLHVAVFYMLAAGILFSILAAVPGLIDLLKTVPPDSSAKKRGVKHGLLNTSMLVIFTIAWFYRRGEEPEIVVLLLLEFAGTVILSIAGWMGGTLVYRNQIGVDPRYANAGKWKEVNVRNGRGPVAVADEYELEVNQMLLVHWNRKRIVLAKTENGYVAFDDRCPHRGGSLAGGSIMCGTVQCPWHGSQFNVQSGAVTAGPAKEGIQTYPVHIEGGKLFLTLDA